MRADCGIADFEVGIAKRISQHVLNEVGPEVFLDLIRLRHDRWSDLDGLHVAQNRDSLREQDLRRREAEDGE